MFGDDFAPLRPADTLRSMLRGTRHRAFRQNRVYDAINSSYHNFFNHLCAELLR